jgi:hypothetical protein
MSGTLSEFNRWHRVASESILNAASNKDAAMLEVALDSAVRSLNYAENDYQTMLALGVIQTIVNLRALSLTQGRSQGTD